MDRRIAGARDRRERDQIAQGPFQFGVRLFHRDNEIESRECAGALCAKADDGGRRTFHHPRAKGDGGEDRRSG